MSTPVQHISATDRPSLDAWPHAVMAALALLITLISAHLVRLTWFDAPASQPLNQPAPIWHARPSLPLAGSDVAAQAVVSRLARSDFADSMFAVMGAPSAPIGLVGEAGRKAEHIGEYIASRDSIALAPQAIHSDAQLAHALVHELAHLWLSHHPDAGAAFQRSLPPLEDSSRYGFGDRSEHAAEALAHAIQFWRASSMVRGTDAQLRLLAAYESIMPGATSALAMLDAHGAFFNAGLDTGVPLPGGL